MRRVRKVLLISFFTVLAFTSCKTDLKDNNVSIASLYNEDSIPTFESYMKETPYWPSENINSKPYSITVELQRDADFIVFTRENGEVLLPNIPRGKKFQDVITHKKGTAGFILPSAGTYILYIYQKKDESTNFNMDDQDFKGKITISEQAIKVKVDDNNAPMKCARQALFEVSNDSYALSQKTQETKIHELIYIDYDKGLTKEKGKNYKNVFYKGSFRYTNLADSSLNDPKKYKRIVLLFPMRFGRVIDRGGFILKGVENKDKLIYYGQPTTREHFYSLSGTNQGQIINTFTPIGDNNYETQWK